MAKIYSPNKKYSGVSAGVRFLDGVGDTDNPVLKKWFREHGYKAVEPEKSPGDMTAAELKAYADGRGIDVSGLTKKEDILARIRVGKKA